MAADALVRGDLADEPLRQRGDARLPAELGVQRRRVRSASLDRGRRPVRRTHRAPRASGRRREGGGNARRFGFTVRFLVTELERGRRRSADRPCPRSIRGRTTRRPRRRACSGTSRRTRRPSRPRRGEPEVVGLLAVLGAERPVAVQEHPRAALAHEAVAVLPGRRRSRAGPSWLARVARSVPLTKTLRPNGPSSHSRAAER